MKRVLAILAMVALTAACGSEDGTSAADEFESPLSEYTGNDIFATGNEDEIQQQFIEQERVRQETIATCMQNLGFEYVAVDPENVIFFDEGDEEWGSEAWSEKYGFGITTQAFSQDQVGPNLVGYDDSGFQDQEDNDPNFAITEAMSDSERDAYYEALYGSEDSFPQIDETLTEEEINEQLEDFDFQPSGCEGEAYAEDSANAFYDEFGDDLSDMYERLESDPRIAEAEQKIATCVGEKGLEYTNMEGLYERFEAQLQDLGAYGGDPFGESMEMTEEEFEAMTDAEREEFFNQGPPPLSDSDKQLLGELQAEEIELALAVNECGGGFEDQQELFREVVVEYEQEFVDANIDRLEQFKTE